MLEALSRSAFEADMVRLDLAAVKRWGWAVINSEYPVFDVIFDHPVAAPLRLRLDCSRWDEFPPSIELLKADGTPVESAPPNVGGVFHPGHHPTTNRFFVCMRGAHEYHTHPSHVNEAWSSHRGKSGNDLIGIVSQLYRAWKKAVG
jgi:hypothetical protein